MCELTLVQSLIQELNGVFVAQNYYITILGFQSLFDESE